MYPFSYTSFWVKIRYVLLIFEVKNEENVHIFKTVFTSQIQCQNVAIKMFDPSSLIMINKFMNEHLIYLKDNGVYGCHLVGYEV